MDATPIMAPQVVIATPVSIASVPLVAAIEVVSIKHLSAKRLREAALFVDSQYNVVIECGRVDQSGQRILSEFSTFFDKFVEVYTAVGDPTQQPLYRASALADKFQYATNKVGMYLSRRRLQTPLSGNLGIYQATGFKGKPPGRTGLKCGGYFLSLRACHEFESHFRYGGVSLEQRMQNKASSDSKDAAMAQRDQSCMSTDSNEDNSASDAPGLGDKRSSSSSGDDSGPSPLGYGRQIALQMMQDSDVASEPLNTNSRPETGKRRRLSIGHNSNGSASGSSSDDGNETDNERTSSSGSSSGSGSDGDSPGPFESASPSASPQTPPQQLAVEKNIDATSVQRNSNAFALFPSISAVPAVLSSASSMSTSESSAALRSAPIAQSLGMALSPMARHRSAFKQTLSYKSQTSPSFDTTVAGLKSFIPPTNFVRIESADRHSRSVSWGSLVPTVAAAMTSTLPALHVAPPSFSMPATSTNITMSAALHQPHPVALSDYAALNSTLPAPSPNYPLLSPSTTLHAFSAPNTFTATPMHSTPTATQPHYITSNSSLESSLASALYQRNPNPTPFPTTAPAAIAIVSPTHTTVNSNHAPVILLRPNDNALTHRVTSSPAFVSNTIAPHSVSAAATAFNSPPPAIKINLTSAAPILPLTSQVSSFISSAPMSPTLLLPMAATLTALPSQPDLLSYSGTQTANANPPHFNMEPLKSLANLTVGQLTLGQLQALNLMLTAATSNNQQHAMVGGLQTVTSQQQQQQQQQQHQMQTAFNNNNQRTHNFR